MTRPAAAPFVALPFVALILLLIVAAMLPLRPARADTQDIAAASRSIVRVALVATKGDSAYFVGHGSGIVVAPNKVLTNAHVVELVRQEPNIVLGVIPPEGTKSYGARIVAFSPGNDLALVEVDGGTLTVATFFASATMDGQPVVAIGYPANVDRAQGMGLADIIKPMTPVKTSGTISTGRSSKQYDTLLHTAPMAAGNSGGALVDTCGRVIGVNSFGSISDGNDAEYGFAVSIREVASFLRQAGVQPLRTVVPCRSLAELDAAEKSATEQARLTAEAKAAAEAGKSRERALGARQDAEQSVIAARENYMAAAAILLAFAVICAGGAGFAQTQGRRKASRLFTIAAILLLAAAIAAFLLRPGFSEVDERTAAMLENSSGELTERPSGGIADGDNLCRIDIDRSRVTVSDTADVPLNWQTSGCINGKTQLVQDGQRWSRILVPADQPSAAIRSVEPATGIYRSENYALDAATADAARRIRAKMSFQGCSADATRQAELARMEGEVRALLPPVPNERLVYRCTATARGH